MKSPFLHGLDHFTEIIAKLKEASYHYADDSTLEWRYGANILNGVAQWMADYEWTRWDVNRFFGLCEANGHEFLVDRDDMLDRLINVYVHRARK